MPANEPKKVSGIFISYRRSDNPDAVGRIYDRLVSEFGKARVFKDVDSIPLGQDFRGHLNDIVGNCAAVLAIIGPKWIDIRNEAGLKRLEDPDDFVRVELEAALARSVPVVPVLVGHAAMPGASQLPSSLTSLVYRQSIEVRPDPDFHNDATRLVVALRAIIDPDAPLPEPAVGLHSRALAPPPAGSAALLKWMSALAAVAIAFAAALTVPALKTLRAVPPTEIRTEIVTPGIDQRSDFALSPDGRQIVFADNIDGVSRLWRRSLATTTAQPLLGTEGATVAFWSPDSRSIAFFSPGGLKRLDVAGGGQPQILMPGIGLGRGAWRADGVILYSGTGTPLMRIAATGGAATEVMRPGSLGPLLFVTTFLPDGRFLLRSAGGTTEGIYLAGLDGSKPVLLTATTAALPTMTYLPNGWMLWMSGQALLAQRLDLRKGALAGEPVTVADGVFNHSASTTGLVAYRAASAIQSQLSWVDRSGTLLGTLGESGSGWNNPRIASDGRRVTASRITGNNADIWLLDGARAGRVTFDASSDMYPAWSADGAHIAFLSSRSGNAGMYQKSASGAGVDELVMAASGYPLGWSSDARYLLYATGTPETKGDIWVLPMTGGRKPFALLRSPFNESRGQFSPDSRWVAYQSDESGSNEIYVRPFAGSNAAAGQWQVSTAGGVDPVWSADGRELSYISPEGDMMATPIEVSGSAVVPGKPVKLFTARIVGGGIGVGGRQYDIARDGRFLINRLSETRGAPITLIQNWNPDAKK